MKQIIKYTFGLLLILSIFSCDKLEISSIQADSFIKLYGSGSSDFGVDVKPFNNGYILLATTTNLNEDTDISLIKTDKYGNQEGDMITFDGGGDDVAGSILLTDDGGFIIVGTSKDIDNDDIYIAKYNSNGEFDWENFIGKSSGSNEEGAVIKKAQTGYIIAGSTDRTGTKDVYLVKIDDSGNLEWDNTFGVDKDDYASDIIMHNDGYLIIGSSNGYDSFNDLGGYDIILIKTNFNGDETHAHVYGKTDDDYGYGVLETDTSFVFVGSQENSSSDAEAYVYMVDKENLLDFDWEFGFGANLYDQGFDIIKNQDGFTIVGCYEITNGTTAAYFLNIDYEGKALLEKTLGNYNQNMQSVETTSDGGSIMIGSAGFEGNEQICLMKVNSKGEL